MLIRGPPGADARGTGAPPPCRRGDAGVSRELQGSGWATAPGSRRETQRPRVRGGRWIGAPPDLTTVLGGNCLQRPRVDTNESRVGRRPLARAPSAGPGYRTPAGSPPAVPVCRRAKAFPGRTGKKSRAVGHEQGTRIPTDTNADTRQGHEKEVPRRRERSRRRGVFENRKGSLEPAWTSPIYGLRTGESIFEAEPGGRTLRRGLHLTPPLFFRTRRSRDLPDPSPERMAGDGDLRSE